MDIVKETGSLAPPATSVSPNGRYEEIANARHFPNVEHPDVFNGIMMGWLDGNR